MTPFENIDALEPRPEARPLAWEEMTEEQQDATRRVGKLVRCLATESFKPREDKPGAEAFLPPIDATRRNHVLLLDGGRGSGKTALLVTYLHVWSYGVRRDATTGEKQAEPHRELQDALEPLGRVVPVGLLDLQPLPEATNLLLYLVTRFKRVVQALESVGKPSGSRPAWHAAEPGGLRSAAEWRRFLQAAAAGWDGSLAGRRAQSDPETYAAELEQAEEQRLDVVLCFRRLMDALVADYEETRWCRGGPPLFVLAIDDADMNAKRAADVVDLVRTLWHPRLAFVLTGQTDLFRAALQVRVAEELSVSGRALPAGEELVRSLPRDIYDKVVPPLHRLELKPIPAADRSALMKKWFSERNSDEEQKRIKRVQELFSRYPMLDQALPDRIRPLQDFALWAPGIDLHGKGVDAGIVEARVLHYLWKHALAAESPVLPIKEWVTEDSKRRVVVSVGPGSRIRVSTTPSRPFGAKDTQSPEVGERLSFEVVNAKGKVLPEALGACLLPLLDHGQDERNSYARVAVAPTFDMSNCAIVSIQVDDDLPRITWSLPSWSRVEDYLAFNERWLKRLNALATTKQETIGELAKAYLDAVFGDEPSKDEDPWQSRADKIRIAVAHHDAASALADWAQCKAPLLAAPESGLDAESANAWLEAVRELYDDESWERARIRIVEERHERMRIATLDTLPPEDPDDFESDDDDKIVKQHLLAIRQKSPDYKWHSRVEDNTSATFDAFVRRMDRISVPGSRSAGTLMSYLTLARRHDLQSAPVNMLGRMHNALEALAKQQGPAGHIAIERLWRIATKDAPTALQEAVQYRRGKLEVDEEKAAEELGVPTLQAIPTGGVRLSTDTASTIELAINRGRLAWSEAKGATPYLRALFLMARDIESDVNTRDDAALSGRWPLAAGVSSLVPGRFPWPAPAWPTFLDWERFLQAWNEKVVPDVAKLAEQAVEAGSHTAGLGDSAAYWYASAIERFSENRDGLARFDFAIGWEPRDWKNYLDARFSEKRASPAPRNARARAFFQFIDHIGLLAAPESGLSEAVAATILDNIPDLVHRREDLAVLRKKRIPLIRVGRRAIRTAQSLKSIDDQFPTHPWVTSIEEPLKQKQP